MHIVTGETFLSTLSLPLLYFLLLPFQRAGCTTLYLELRLDADLCSRSLVSWFSDGGKNLLSCAETKKRSQPRRARCWIPYLQSGDHGLRQVLPPPQF